MLEISVNKEVEVAFDELLLFRACQAALSAEEISAAEIDILIVNDQRMQELNNAYLAHDYTTDVLSFELGETPDGALVGQLIVCADFAQREADERQFSQEEELARYVVHGTLHLLGYDDHDEADKAEMWAVQESIVAQLFTREQP